MKKILSGIVTVVFTVLALVCLAGVISGGFSAPNKDISYEGSTLLYIVGTFLSIWITLTAYAFHKKYKTLNPL